MKTLIFLCPYFGTLPYDQMILWLNCCRFNPTIDWLIYTDDRTNYDYPDNVRIRYLSFDEMKQKTSNKFDFPIVIDRAYKLCDYKPAYGYIFEDDIKGYEYWGHCDMSDSLFGDLRKFLTDDILTQNDKTLFWGHMSIYRNDYEVNRRFMLGSKSSITYRDVFSNPENMCFDEVHNYSIDAIYKDNGYNFTRLDSMYHDINPLYYWFRVLEMADDFIPKQMDNVYRVYWWKNGKLYEVQIKGVMLREKEVGYIHYQKRKLEKRFQGLSNDYLIAPDGFWENDGKLDTSWIKKHAKKKRFYAQYFRLRLRNLKYKIKHFGRIAQ